MVLRCVLLVEIFIGLKGYKTMENEKKQNSKISELLDSIGATSEIALIFYRNTIRAGANVNEATHCTQAFIAALMHGDGRKDK